MASLKNIKIKIGSVHKTRKVTRAMEAVSAVKMRKSQDRALGSRVYASAALSILKRISGSVDMKGFSLMNVQEGKMCVVVITSDKGLAGNLNNAVLRKTDALLESRGLTKEDTIFVCIGRRGADYYEARGYDVAERHENVSDDAGEVDTKVITDAILEMHAKKDIGSCVVTYTNFLSTFEQEAVVREIIPITSKMIEEMVRGIVPTKGTLSDAKEGVTPSTYTVEPDADAVFSEVLPHLVNIAVFHALLESKASEHSARMVAMKNATDKAGEVARDLTLVFNKARQAAITREVSEITSGIEAMK